MKYRLHPHIRTPKDLGIAVLGSSHTAIVPPKRRSEFSLRENAPSERRTLHPVPIDRTEYGRRLAETEGGIFTPLGYFVPINNMDGKRTQ